MGGAATNTRIVANTRRERVNRRTAPVLRLAIRIVYRGERISLLGSRWEGPLDRRKPLESTTCRLACHPISETKEPSPPSSPDLKCKASARWVWVTEGAPARSAMVL